MGESTDNRELLDPVNKPQHYRSHPSGIEVIQITEHMGFCLGNAIKYILRCEHKGNKEQDLRKAIWYIERELKRCRPKTLAEQIHPDLKK
jgi:hypothetical protein